MSFPTEQCLKVIDKISEKKMAQIYMYPVDPKNKNSKGYFQVVKKPMDLGTIRKKIQEKKYRTVKEWRNDIELIWSNSLQYYQKQTIYYNVTKYLQEYFREISNDISDYPEVDWSTRLYEMIGQLNKLLLNAPEKYKPRIRRPKRVNSYDDSKKRSYRQFSSDEITSLIYGLNIINNNEAIKEIFDVIKENEEDFDSTSDNLNIDLESLSTSTLYALRNKINFLLSK